MTCQESDTKLLVKNLLEAAAMATHRGNDLVSPFVLAFKSSILRLKIVARCCKCLHPRVVRFHRDFFVDNWGGFNKWHILLFQGFINNCC